MALRQAVNPFRFSTRLSIRETTGLRAVTLPQLLKGLQTVSGSVIFHHTHHYLQQFQFLVPEPPNNFAYWVSEVLGEKRLGEQLASIDTVQFATIRELREAIIVVLEGYLREHPVAQMRFAEPEEALYFVKAVSVILSTKYEARNLQEFAEGLEAVTLDSLYFHIFEARLRLERGHDDFSLWLEDALGEEALAKAIRGLDPYTRTLEELRQTISWLVRQRVAALEGA